MDVGVPELVQALRQAFLLQRGPNQPRHNQDVVTGVSNQAALIKRHDATGTGLPVTKMAFKTINLS